jgi:hypothetical protein
MRRLSGRAQWGVILGLFFVQQMLARSSVPASLVPLTKLLLWSLVAFILLTWIADPLFNLLLRVNRLGRLALSRNQIWASNCVGTCLLLALAALLGWGISGDFRFALTALVSAGLILPIAASFKCSPGWMRLVMICYTISLAMLGIGAIVLAVFVSHIPEDLGDTALALFKLCFYLFLLGLPATTWLYSLLALVRMRR